MSEALSLFKQRTVRVLLLVYLVAVPYWLWISLTGQVSSVHNYVWSLIFLGIFPVFAGVSGILLSKKWGFLSAALGRAIFFFSAGVVAWGVGSIIFAYYNLVLGIEVPSPGLADVVYVLSYPFWALGLINLGRGMGAGYKLRTSKGKIAIVLIPIIGLALTYFIFVTIVQGGVFDFKDAGFIKIFLNIFYPLGDFAIITGIGLIYSLSYKMFGGRFKWPINILLIGQFVLYCADSGFSYTAIQETFYVANWVDLLFAHALLLLSVGVNALDIQGISSRVRAELVTFAPRAGA
ncbi:MAG: hypothetical protein HYR95_00870, partial [Candidatus Colwellbacteria bacterium]|nr:hypothetical protein [Candidatus Colwellbacteria bacterium]